MLFRSPESGLGPGLGLGPVPESGLGPGLGPAPESGLGPDSGCGHQRARRRGGGAGDDTGTGQDAMTRSQRELAWGAGARLHHVAPELAGEQAGPDRGQHSAAGLRAGPRRDHTRVWSKRARAEPRGGSEPRHTEGSAPGPSATGHTHALGRGPLCVRPPRWPVKEARGKKKKRRETHTPAKVQPRGEWARVQGELQNQPKD